jgi:hypothetical protein
MLTRKNLLNIEKLVRINLLSTNNVLPHKLLEAFINYNSDIKDIKQN